MNKNKTRRTVYAWEFILCAQIYLDTWSCGRKQWKGDNARNLNVWKGRNIFYGYPFSIVLLRTYFCFLSSSFRENRKFCNVMLNSHCRSLSHSLRLILQLIFSACIKWHSFEHRMARAVLLSFCFPKEIPPKSIWCCSVCIQSVARWTESPTDQQMNSRSDFLCVN